jgi:hypothetical protein
MTEWLAQNWTWGLTAASIVGTVANAYKKRWSFWVWLVTNSLWCWYAVATRQYAQAVLWFVYTVLAIVGLVQWKKAG